MQEFPLGVGPWLLPPAPEPDWSLTAAFFCLRFSRFFWFFVSPPPEPDCWVAAPLTSAPAETTSAPDPAGSLNT